MNQIKCPNCGEVFTIDESNYASIVDQIRNEEFVAELAKREASIKDKARMEMEYLKNQYENDKHNAMSDKDKTIAELKHNNELLESKYETKMVEALAKKDDESRKAEAESGSKLQVLQEKIAKLEMELTMAKNDKDAALKEADVKKQKELSEALTASNIKIAQLEDTIRMNNEKVKTDLANINTKNESEKNILLQQIRSKDTEKELAVQKAIAELTSVKNKEIQEVTGKLDSLKTEAKIKEDTLTAKYNEMVASKDKEIERQQEIVQQYKDFKLKQSTKMIGESLEQHCSYEFNKNRMGMFPHAYFEKDNDARNGSKGDFIFKDYDNETEIISIMFEMKNEADDTAIKHKNEDFFAKLDKDRNEKGCEYAILVTMLEPDNELYNEGIVDVSYRYPKMYVIRPQFFIPMISLLRNAALNSVEYKKQLMIEKSNNLDVSNFEKEMNDFKEGFGKNFMSATKHFEATIDEIDKTISHLTKIKEELTTTGNQLRLANNKAQDLTIKKLTKNAPSVARKIEEARNE